MNICEVYPKTGRAKPETVLQIGEGNFLRAFADWMLEKAQKAGVWSGDAVLCQPLPNGLAHTINAQNGLYTVLLRGIENGQVVEQADIIHCVSRCLNPYENFEDVLQVCKSPELSVVISNTTEAGIAYRTEDLPSARPPVSFPAKLAVLLLARYQEWGHVPGKGLLILPVELVENNGDLLKSLVLRYAQEWGLEAGFQEWLQHSCCFANTLVDRIVTGHPQEEMAGIGAKLGYEDELLVACEPFNLWVIQAPEEWQGRFPLDKAGCNIVFTQDLAPYRTRKVRILNGAHTVSALAALRAGHSTVLSMMQDPVFLAYIRRVIWQEIIPGIYLPQKDMDAFAQAVLERFSNPFVQHCLSSIALNSVSKFKARCLPSILDYQRENNAVPPVLAFGLAALIDYYKSMGAAAQDNDEVLAFFAGAPGGAAALAQATLANATFWGEDLSRNAALLTCVQASLLRIETIGMAAAVAEVAYA